MSSERNGARQRFRDFAMRAEERLSAARGIADRCRDDEDLHRAAMRAVFTLEDTVFALSQIADSLQPQT